MTSYTYNALPRESNWFLRKLTEHGVNILYILGTITIDPRMTEHGVNILYNLSTITINPLVDTLKYAQDI